MDNLKINCPCCNAPIDPKAHRGVVINRINYLGSQLMSLREQMERISKKKPTPQLTKVELDSQKEKTLNQINLFEKEQKDLKLLLIEEKKMTDTSNTVPVIEEPKPETEVIQFADFAKVDLRVGRIVSAERIPKKDRLLKLDVSFGELGKRTIVAGIAESFDPNVLVGRQSIFVLNLAPRKMAGIESCGMILAALREDGVASLAEVSSPVPDGSKVG